MSPCSAAPKGARTAARTRGGLQVRVPTLVAAVLGLTLLAGCERPPAQSTQNGPRGSGMVQIHNPRSDAALQAAQPAVPDLPPPGGNDGPKAKDVYQNVKVLGDLSVGEFTRHMLAITQWVAPEQGCAYCHGANLADDSLYTKVVARRMIEMNRHLNVDWTRHVGGTGVTCYTCHRGKPVPANIAYLPAPPKNNRVGAGMGNDAGQNKAEPSIALASLPYDPFTPYLKDEVPIRVQTTTALPTGNLASTKQAEFTYSLMNHMSTSLGVNCTFCHNTQSFQSWNGPAQRVTAYHGIRMARDLNNAYLEPLAKTFPANRLGPTGDVAKVNCATCHQGVNKPLGGLAMAKNWPGLMTTAAQAAAAAPVAVPAAAATPVVAAPMAVAAAQPQKEIVYFPVNSPLLKGDEVKKIDKVLAALNAQPDSTATLSGYHSATGKLAANQQLAKQRAFKIRDALIAAGVSASRIKLDKPQQTEANIKGEDPFARRVEVTVK
jgi:photosynthetic reaction center cytochrome c subunit